MIDKSYNEWDVESYFHLQAEKNLKEAERTFVVAHTQALLSKKDKEIINDELLFRGLVWMSPFSEYAHKRLYAISECLPPSVKVSCTDDQQGWENYPVPYFTLKQKEFSDDDIDFMKKWFKNFSYGRWFMRCPIIYAQNGKFGQLQYEHDIRNDHGRVLCNDWGKKKVLLDNDFSYCMRYIAENWWYYPASSTT